MATGSRRLSQIKGEFGVKNDEFADYISLKNIPQPMDPINLYC